jgi:hypothetical protein
MGNSKFFRLGQPNTGATNYKDYILQSSTPGRPKPGKIRTWFDSLGIFNFLPESGPGYKTLIGTQGNLSLPGGDPRGQDATDLQFDRQSDDQVAAGDRSFIGGGRNNKSFGANSFIAAGEENIINDDSCFATGVNNNVAGIGSHASGTGNLVEGEASHAEGYYNAAYGPFSHAEGINAKTYLTGQHAKSSGFFSENGDSQYTNVILKGITSDVTPLTLSIDGNIGILLEGNKMNTFRILVVAKKTDNSQGAAYELKGLIKKDANSVSTALIGSVTKTVIAESVSSWGANVTADTTTGSLKITVTGEASKTIRWVAFCEMVEVQ